MTETVPVCYDPRSLQLVTPVRDQQNLALCWDYAGIALMESALLIKGYRGADVDLSELHGACSIPSAGRCQLFWTVLQTDKYKNGSV